MMNKVNVWDLNEISDDMEYIFAIYGHDYINGNVDELADLLEHEFCYRPPHYVLNFLARMADDF